MPYHFNPNTLLRAAYFIIALDTGLAFFFACIAIYLTTGCIDAMIEHVTFLLHFVQTLAILSTIDLWQVDLKEGDIKSYSPYLWIGSSILSLLGDVSLLVYQVKGVHACETVTKLHIAMDSMGIVICVFSIVWFIAVSQTVKASREALSLSDESRMNAFGRPYFDK